MKVNQFRNAENVIKHNDSKGKICGFCKGILICDNENELYFIILKLISTKMKKYVKAETVKKKDLNVYFDICNSLCHVPQNQDKFSHFKCILEFILRFILKNFHST